jgi:hypothetical protein
MEEVQVVPRSPVVFKFSYRVHLDRGCSTPDKSSVGGNVTIQELVTFPLWCQHPPIHANQTPATHALLPETVVSAEIRHGLKRNNARRFSGLWSAGLISLLASRQ